MKRDLKNIEQKASCMRPYYLFKKKKKVPQGLRSKMECLNKLVELSIKKTEACEVCIEIYIYISFRKKKEDGNYQLGNKNKSLDLLT